MKTTQTFCKQLVFKPAPWGGGGGVTSAQRYCWKLKYIKLRKGSQKNPQKEITMKEFV